MVLHQELPVIPRGAQQGQDRPCDQLGHVNGALQFDALQFIFQDQLVIRVDVFAPRRLGEQVVLFADFPQDGGLERHGLEEGPDHTALLPGCSSHSFFTTTPPPQRCLARLTRKGLIWTRRVA